jgi:hypothetical protein
MEVVEFKRFRAEVRKGFPADGANFSRNFGLIDMLSDFSTRRRLPRGYVAV